MKSCINRVLRSEQDKNAELLDAAGQGDKKIIPFRKIFTK